MPTTLLERRFERMIWRFRLISIVPVLLSLLGSIGCFAIGASEVLSAFWRLLSHPIGSSSLQAKSIAQMVGGVDYFVIGIALLIFGYGIYELVISDLDPRHEGDDEQHANLLSVSSLESLKHNLTNVIVVALIVSAFKKMIDFEVNNSLELLALCGCVAMLALSVWLIAPATRKRNQISLNCRVKDAYRDLLSVADEMHDLPLAVELTEQAVGLIQSAHRFG